MKSKPVFITIVSLFFILFLLSCNNHDNRQNLIDALQTKLDSAVKQGMPPGITLSVLFEDGDEILLSSGFSDLENKTPMMPTQPMFSGSVGKTYVSAVVLMLYEDGLVDIKKKVIEYIKDEPWFDSIPNSKDFTVEMLLNHTAGIPEYAYFPEIWEKIEKDPDKIWTVRERLSVTFNQPPTGIAGKEWNYADSHYLILGLLLEKITGKAYYSLLMDKILQPLGLTNTYFADKRTFDKLPSGYTTHSGDMNLPAKITVNNTYAFNPQLEWTGGGLISTVSDLTKWADNLYGGTLFKSETLKLITTPVEIETPLFEKAGYGLGCIVGQTNGTFHYGHTGFVPGYMTFLQYIPDYKFAVAMQINTDNRDTGNNMKILMNSIKTEVSRYLIP